MVKTIYDKICKFDTTAPLDNVTYTIFDDVGHEVRTYRGWNATAGTATGPTEVTRVDYPGSYAETLTMAATPAVSGAAGTYAPTGTEAIASIQTLARALADSSGRVVEDDAYASLAGTTYSTTALRLGTAGTNYYATYHGFDAMGRPARTLDATGTITDTTYDALGRVASVSVGTADTYTPGPTGPSNMVQVAASQYDANGVGDGNLTRMTWYPDAVAADARVTAYAYDWRDRLVATKAGVQSTEDTTTHRPTAYYDRDNLGAVTGVSHFDGDTVTLTNAKPSLSLLRAYTATSYDDQGRAYLAQTYSVDQANGTTSMATLTATTPLTTGMYYDHRGAAIAAAAPGGLVAKAAYDGAGRLVKQSSTDGAGGTGWANAGTVAGDHVLTQTLTAYDAAGNAILTTTRDRFDTDTSADTGDLGSPTVGPKARVSYMADYYDAANRPTATVNVGTNGGTAYTRPASPATPSDTALVTSTAYNAAGWAAAVTDPRGIVTATSYDLLGRTTQTIAGYNASINGGNPTNSANATTRYTYDGAGHILTVQAVMPTGTPGQTTTYVYGVGAAGNLYSNDLLAATVQPDKATGAYPSPANLPGDEKVYTYNALGQRTGMTDENGTVHAYAYDVLGRRTSDAVTTLGTGVDGAVRRLATAYDTGGRPYLFTSYSAASGGAVVNQVQRAYNGLGQLVGEYQEHGGAVNTSITPEVQYAYNLMAGGANNSRLTSVTYPNGHVINDAYNAGLDGAIGRVSALVDGAGGTAGTTLEGYAYLGLGTIVKETHPEPGIDLSYLRQPGDTTANSDGGDPYTGLDRFGRVIDQNWVRNDGTSSWAAVDRFQYGHDRAGNVLYKNNLVNPAFSELYHANSATSGDNATAYDALGRLTAFARGTLSASGHNGAGLDTIASSTHGQSWALDALGNWSGVTTDGSTVTRAANAENQTTSISGLSGASAPTYDTAGNTTGDYSQNNGITETFAYDAWNRLVAVKGPGGVVQATYAVDALGRRIAETYPQSINPQTGHLYYSPQWQVIEERYAGTANSNVMLQYVWGLGYVDDLIEREDFTAGVRMGRNYALQNANYDVTAVTDPAGSVQERHVYDPYGAATVLSAAWAPMAGTLGWRYLHQGGRMDPASGDYNFRRRDYIASEGRWAERDPVGLAAGDLNEYQFLDDNPYDGVDPNGEAKKKFVPRPRNPRILTKAEDDYVKVLVRNIEITVAECSCVPKFTRDFVWRNLSYLRVKQMFTGNQKDSRTPITVFATAQSYQLYPGEGALATLAAIWQLAGSSDGNEGYYPISTSDYEILSIGYFGYDLNTQIRILLHESYHEGTGYWYVNIHDRADDVEHLFDKCLTRDNRNYVRMEENYWAYRAKISVTTGLPLVR